MKLRRANLIRPTKGTSCLLTKSGLVMPSSSLLRIGPDSDDEITSKRHRHVCTRRRKRRRRHLMLLPLQRSTQFFYPSNATIIDSDTTKKKKIKTRLPETNRQASRDVMDIFFTTQKKKKDHQLVFSIYLSLNTVQRSSV